MTSFPQSDRDTRPESPKPVVFIHTNDQQMVAAKVCAHSLVSRSSDPEGFEIRLLRLEDTPQLYPGREGCRYRCAGQVFTWHNRDLQAFAPLRMLVPSLMGFAGRALVLDPDVFAVGDVAELIHRDMRGKAVLCRARDGWQDGRPVQFYSTAVMLLDCARLTNWRWNEAIDAIFSMRMDLMEWLHLSEQPPETIGVIQEEWNHLDILDARTKLLHNTERLTQPWKTGLPVDFDLDAEGSYPYKPGVDLRGWLRRAERLLFPPAPREPGLYQPHPDPRQERLFFTLLREALAAGAMSEAFLENEIRRGHLRVDAFELLRRFDGKEDQ